MQNITLNDTIEGAFAADGEVGVACELPIPTTGDRKVVLRFAVSAGVAPGLYPASVTAGLVAADDASYVDADCPVARVVPTRHDGPEVGPPAWPTASAARVPSPSRPDAACETPVLVTRPIGPRSTWLGVPRVPDVVSCLPCRGRRWAGRSARYGISCG